MKVLLMNGRRFDVNGVSVTTHVCVSGTLGMVHIDRESHRYTYPNATRMLIGGKRQSDEGI